LLQAAKSKGAARQYNGSAGKIDTARWWWSRLNAGSITSTFDNAKLYVNQSETSKIDHAPDLTNQPTQSRHA